MIPVRLFVRNFMSYGEPGEELDFSFHTACVCGDNGNGKSALIDAMTWALWGRAPRLEGTQAKGEEIIRRAPGVNEALVEFQFSVGADLYRIIRRLRRARGMTLEFYAAQDGSWRSLSGVTKTDTERLIQSILGLDYQTFVMSSFLFQGRADAFTRAAPTERKEALGRILRLDIYDELAKRARDLSRECEGRAKQLADEAARLQAQADREQELALKERAAQEALAQGQRVLAQCEEELEQARRRKTAADQAAVELRRAEERLRQVRAQAESLARQEADFRRRVEGHRAALAQEQALREQAARLEQARRRDAELSARREQAAQAEAARHQAQALIAAEKARLEQEVRQVESALEEARSAAGAAPTLAAQAAELEGQVQACQEAERALDACRAEMEQLRTRQAANREAERVLRAELAEVSARIEALAAASARCPLCEQELGEELRGRLLDQARALAASKESSLADLERTLDGTAGALKQLEAKIRSIQPHAARAGALQKALGQVQQRYEQARSAAARADEIARRAQDLRRTLESRAFAAAAQEQLAQAETWLAQIAYDPQEHKQVQDIVRSLAQVERELGALEAARAALPRDEAHLEQLRANLAAANEAVAAAQGECERLQALAADAAPAAQALAQAEQQRAVAMQERERLVGEVAAVRAEIAACARAREEAQRCRARREAAANDAIIYGELAQAFGRQGVQALVVETVVPQLTEDANALLRGMSEGRMSVELVTQRERADGGAAETLDIHISDELGTRRYELYSGGEAFRVDFAIRVALARLLARRAGARLQTLVIDEGFGSQDTAARDRLVACINAIQDDFEKVLVITHIEELKDAFEERIEVTKDETGSHIRRHSAGA